ncbi:MAG TPA: biopolymer transporter ExbD, partial [Armatimonadota bacterium]|nr:biopolymer transporter ExbD [Armatimonadota bacterium]
AMTTMKGLPVNLPKSQSAQDRPMVKVVLTLTENGNYYIDKKQVEFEDIYTEMKARLTENPKIVVVINCDKKQSWQKGIELADEAKRAGAQLLTIATEPKGKPV